VQLPIFPFALTEETGPSLTAFILKLFHRQNSAAVSFLEMFLANAQACLLSRAFNEMTNQVRLVSIQNFVESWPISA
jgi:hypothetical protein